MIALRARRVLAYGEERHGWWVTLDGAHIADVSDHAPEQVRTLDLGDVDLIPGLVDLHSDCLEQKSHPRPTTDLPLSAALLDLDAEVIAHGITTHFVCVSLEDDAVKYRSMNRALETVACITNMRPRLRADHLVHLRIDVTGSGHVIAEQLLSNGVVRMLSYMDHTPGQGQYADEADWRKFYGAIMGVQGEDLERRLALKRAGQSQAESVREQIAGLAHNAGVSLVSHDDDSTETVDRATTLGVHVCEFPVNQTAASAARAAGLGVLMGAPNARRGRSHLTNLSAREALASGCLDALASDYHPPSLLAAAYLLSETRLCSWSGAIELVSANPARLALLPDRGSIAKGMRADLVAVALEDGYPVVQQTWVAGRKALGIQATPVAA
ncbi:MAG: alpha-D-ribose 1-methylphosphonate 5-triphosphate diphosphatase [Chloroflexi bacterium]|nr:alpha-D-ribose 1-methylphosphonate 5-triphosphate diphosphatase [Chloroflexota bacterium]